MGEMQTVSEYTSQICIFPNNKFDRQRKECLVLSPCMSWKSKFLEFMSAVKKNNEMQEDNEMPVYFMKTQFLELLLEM